MSDAPNTEPAEPRQPPTQFFNDPNRQAREQRVAQHLKGRADAAAAESADQGGNEFEQREAGLKAAAQEAANLSNPNPAPPLADAAIELTAEQEIAYLKEELKSAKAALAERESGELSPEQIAVVQQMVSQEKELPDPTTVSDDFYFRNRAAYQDKLGLRRRGLSGI